MRRSSRSRTLAGVAAAIVAAVALTGCIPQALQPPPGPADPDQTGTTPTGTSVPADVEVGDFLTDATADGGSSVGSLHGDEVEAGSGPAISVPDNATAVNGGSLQIDVTSADPFSTVLVSVGPTGAGSTVPTPWPGSWQVDLADATTSSTVVLTLAQDLPAAQFSVVVAVVAPNGTVSQLDSTNVAIVEVGTGDVQVSVSWYGDSDVDLYVVDPNGDTIFYGSPTSPSGGELDLDSNPSCSFDDVRNENVTWPTGEAPSGTYEVRLNLYADCGEQQSSWVVTVQALGQTYRWEGILEAPGTGGGEEAGMVIARFDVA